MAQQIYSVIKLEEANRRVAHVHGQGWNDSCFNSIPFNLA